mmetsp:Transcript_11419/g.21582  ORF Transcript_11419/g.21582 Transcript_11419/m.21582 type:complete len:287 (-) Transcript_11419:175-1035(-)
MSQAQVQPPPGFEGHQGMAAESHCAAAAELKAQLIAEVTQAVKGHVDGSVEALYAKAMTYMQKQAAQAEKIQCELQRCSEAYRSLERENAMLRATLQALCRQLLGAPMHCGLFPFGDAKEDSPSVSTDVEEPSDPLEPAPQLSSVERSSHREMELAESDEGAAGSGETGSPGSEPPSLDPASVFSLTLRRADTVPVGLHVQGDDGLLVERILPGGAVEAWNRQCPGDYREIRPGDRIIKINGREDAEGMRSECLQKLLLKMTVQRGSTMNLRAEADEFVPQVIPES